MLATPSAITNIEKGETMSNTIHEVMEYGSIIASDEDFDILIGVNGAYFNLWVGDGTGRYNNTECYDMASRVEGADGRSSNGLYGLDIVKVIEAGKALLESILSGEDEEE